MRELLVFLIVAAPLILLLFSCDFGGCDEADDQIFSLDEDPVDDACYPVRPFADDIDESQQQDDLE